MVEGALAESRAAQQVQFLGKTPCALSLQSWESRCAHDHQANGVHWDDSLNGHVSLTCQLSVARVMFSYMTQYTHDGEDICKFWRSYLVLRDIHCLGVSLHVMASVGFLVKSMVRMAESYERVARRVETIFQGLMRG
jgi:hypothetical protein